jgi:hypothetical protein
VSSFHRILLSARAHTAIPCVFSSRFSQAMQEPLLPHILEIALPNKIASHLLFPKCKSSRTLIAQHLSGRTWGRITFAGELIALGMIRKISSVCRFFCVKMSRGVCPTRSSRFSVGSRRRRKPIGRVQGERLLSMGCHYRWTRSEPGPGRLENSQTIINS